MNDVQVADGPGQRDIQALKAALLRVREAGRFNDNDGVEFEAPC